MHFRNCGSAFQFLRDRDLPMMARHSFVIGQRRHAPFRDFVHVAQVGEENSRTRAVHRARLVIRARRGRFLESRRAALRIFAFGNVRNNCFATLQSRCRSGACIRRALRARPLSSFGKESADPCPACPSTAPIGWPANPLASRNRAHLAFDPRHFAQAEIVHLVRLERRRRVLAQGVGVKRVAVRQFPDAVVGRRLRQDRL